MNEDIDQVVQITVPATAAGMRLDAFLAAWARRPAVPTVASPAAGNGVKGDSHLTCALNPRDRSRGQYEPTQNPLSGWSRARLQRLLEAQQVQVAGRAVAGKYKLKGGELVSLWLPCATPLLLQPIPMPLSVLFEDEHIIVVDKPAGLVVHPGAGRAEPTLVHGLLAHCRDLSGIGGVARPGIVHRLDRGTSGVIVVAKHDQAHQGMARQFSGRQVRKHYLALVLGVPTPPLATIDTYYARHPIHRQRFTSRVTTGRRALTRYRVRTHMGGAAWLDVDLGTGRTHQIRVHLAERGHPIVGDALYGGRNAAALTHSELRVACSALTHQALHAARLQFAHPISGDCLDLQAPLPHDLAAIAALFSW